MSKAKIMCSILHKMDDDKTNLQIGKTFRFPSGTRMTVLATGQVVNPDKQRTKRKITIG